ncbi:hypothetical protein AVEN_68956-1 [Araneus ventricosus]|uniref:SH3 domain-containing protein n=1 Tax=Araneus ventricosus TaxID=182803 RepID=A0A4Y2HI68_ARAVE|nr:hypothetical protein AVEN_68956-1 [Araneus ventricosus]
MNTAKYFSTGQTAAFLTFGRELRTVDKVQNDLRSVILKDTFVPEITPYLKRFSKFMAEAKEVAEMQQDLRKECGDRKRQKAPNNYFPGDRVFVTTHHLSNATKGRTTKFIPKRDGPYIILTQKSPSYVIANPGNPNEPVGTYHTSALKVYKQDESVTPVHPLRKRGRPRKTYTSGSSTKTDIGGGWWEGRNNNGDHGLFPSSYVEKTSDPSKDTPAGFLSVPSIEKKSSSTGDLTVIARGDASGKLGIKKSFNRFSAFVKSGGEMFILGETSVNVSAEDFVEIMEDDGEIGWVTSGEQYSCTVSKPKKESKLRGLKSYIAYQITPSVSKTLKFTVSQ